MGRFKSPCCTGVQDLLDLKRKQFEFFDLKSYFDNCLGNRKWKQYTNKQLRKNKCKDKNKKTQWPQFKLKQKVVKDFTLFASSSMCIG